MRKKNTSKARRGTAPRRRASKNHPDEQFVLRLYVTGITAKSTQAIANIRSCCEEHLQGKFNLEVIDIYQQPAEAVKSQIIAAPTLIKYGPAPMRKMIGNLTDRNRILMVLDIKSTTHPRQNRPGADKMV